MALTLEGLITGRFFWWGGEVIFESFFFGGGYFCNGLFSEGPIIGILWHIIECLTKMKKIGHSCDPPDDLNGIVLLPGLHDRK